ncbi:MAG: hypothetical protein WA156_16170 [Methylocystis silviterrae]
MGKKSLESVTADLAALAAAMPTQRPVAPLLVPQLPQPELQIGKPTFQKRPGIEPLTQFSFSLRKSLRKDLARLASDADMTMQAFILSALKVKGLAVRDDDLVDRRKSGEKRA